MHQETLELQLKPVTGNKAERWTLRLGPDLLTLVNPDDREVITLPRDETSRYVRFTYDLLHGRTVSFVIIEGLRAYSFKCPGGQVKTILTWLPSGAPQEVTREVRYSGIGVALFGVVHLLMAQTLFWGWGLALIIAGILSLALPRRFMYAVNGILMLGIGLWDLSMPSRLGAAARILPPEYRIAPIAIGAALLLWGIQQLSMLSFNHRLRAARAVRDEEADFLPGRSRICIRIGYLNLAATLLFGAYAVLLATVRIREYGLLGCFSEMNLALADLIVAAILTVVTLVFAVLFLGREKPAYIEGKLALQVLLAAAIFLAWAAAFSIRDAAFAPLWTGLLAANRAVFVSPCVWLSLTAAVLLLNRWYHRAVDRELEELRDAG